MKYLYPILITLLLLGSLDLKSKNQRDIDSLLHQIDTTTNDTIKLKALYTLAWKFMFIKPDTALQIGRTAFNLSKSRSDTIEIINALNNIATAYAIKGQYTPSLQFFNEARTLATAKNLAEDLSNILNNIGLVYWNQGKLDSAISLYSKALTQYQNMEKLVVGMANTHNNLGLIYKNKGDNDLAIENYKEALTLFDSLDRKDRAVANTINNLGIALFDKGNYPSAIEYYLKALKMYESVDNQSSGHANTLINIGNLYKEQKEYVEALSYFKKAETMHKRISIQSVALANTYGIIGETYMLQSKNEEAIEYLKKALEMQESMGEKTIGITQALSNLGKIYMDYRENYPRANTYFNKALEIQKEIGDIGGVASSLYYLGSLNIKENKINDGIKKCKESYLIAEELNSLKLIQNSCECLGDGYEKAKNPFKALHYYKLFFKSRDSLLNNENTRAITQQTMSYEFEKVQYQDSLKRAEQTKLRLLEQREKDLKKEAQIKRQRIYTVSGGIGFLLMLGLAFVLFRGYKNKQKSNEIISAQKEAVEKQKSVIEIKNKEILDSINYAKRIQNTILPDDKELSKNLGENYVLFRPKDIVSGDFYWTIQKGDDSFFSVVDCTGHGVPGALVSIVANNSLNRVMNEFKIRQPAAILDSLNQLVEENFSTTTSSINDGMDLALCKLNRKKMELEYSGANNPLYLIRASTIEDPELAMISSRVQTDKHSTLYEIKADKQPVGKYEFRENFSNHLIKVQKGDCIYIFSDGFADQFGGENGKKYMYKPFKRLLLKLSGIEMSAQKKKMEATFDDWKKDLEQIDDVCIMGVRV